MKILIKRQYKKEKYTIGKMYIDGVYFCDTLEPPVRADGVKVYGKTAIPAGTYKVVMSYSPKFKRRLPEVLAVPNFVGIRFHAGNRVEDTHGCCCVGKNKVVAGLTESRATESRICSLLEREKEIFVTYEN